MLDLEFSSSEELRRHYDGVHARLRYRPASNPVRALPAPKPELVLALVARGRDWLMVSDPLPPDTEPTEPAGMPKWRRISLEVAAKYKLTLPELLSNRRAKELVCARHEAMYRMKMETSLSFAEIGRRIGGRDHTTILHGVRKHIERMAGERT